MWGTEYLTGTHTTILDFHCCFYPRSPTTPSRNLSSWKWNVCYLVLNVTSYSQLRLKWCTLAGAGTCVYTPCINVEARGQCQLFFILFFWWCLSVNPKLIMWLCWLVSELQGPTWLHLSSTGITDVCFHAQLFLGCRGSESRSSCLHSKHIIYCSIAPVPALPTS